MARAITHAAARQWRPRAAALTRRASAQAASAGPGAAPRPFLEARLELAAHNASILYLKHVSLAVQARGAWPYHIAH
jgi:hypothetical protein